MLLEDDANRPCFNETGTVYLRHGYEPTASVFINTPVQKKTRRHSLFTFAPPSHRNDARTNYALWIWKLNPHQ